ncbi:unnamed protein product [Rotaria sp. Silwood1]|nr:unnamed protein product [Rotaria sp. Silwood1]CAF1418509.1 unnamed protein product [Rotaria sp. Silwood1]CAF3545994.1 unnamed protein product [Rotaria sp. Silwood1]CAF3643677.1 unnamed protein product [Rotaria sp. Silwood1]CAF4636879.1 unnamed protein product [Rotaria sp. Silwood1]
MASASHRTSDDFVKRLIRSNKDIQLSTYSIISQFRDLQKRFSRNVASVYSHLGTVKDVVNIFLDDEKMATLKQFKAMDKIELVVCGKKSSGKTSFIQQLLQCGTFLPIGFRNVTQRNVKFSYAPIEQVCLLIHRLGKDSHSTADRIDVSSFFQTRIPSKTFNDIIQHYLIRRDDTIESEDWTSCLVEICIPSPFLQLNIEVYDIAEPIDMKNIQITRPCFLFLYDNAPISDDTQKYYEELKLSICNMTNGAIFFLNTKVDVNDMLHDVEINEFLDNERHHRYEHLKNVPTMNNELPRTLAECDCFDIFSVKPCEHPVTITMRKDAIDRIFRFAFEHALRNTQQVSTIMLDAIDGFFDFVLITNCRSSNEWNVLRDEALHWANEFFQQYRLQIDIIGDEAQRQFLVQFRQQREQLMKKILVHRQERHQQFSLPNSGLSLISAMQPMEISDEKHFLELIIREEIIRPILSKIFDEISHRVNQQVDQSLLVKRSTRNNELIRAAYREFLNNINIIDNKRRRDYFNKQSFKEILAGISGFMNTIGTIFSITELLPEEVNKRDNEPAIKHDLITIETYLTTIGERIKRNIRDGLEENERNFKEKIHAYHKIVLGTMDHRHRAHRLARSFAVEFAQIECLLAANLDLIKHYGTTPTIDFRTLLGNGGFFSVHPASWGSERNLVAKVLLDSTGSFDFAYVEAHFHRTVTRLHIEHMVPLRFLYHDIRNNRLCILLPRYSMSLHTYLTNHMADISISDAVRIVLHISRAVAHMHAQNLIHRDIKAQNILLDNDKNVFLADFGTCQHGTENTTIVGSHPLAPEMSNNKLGREFSYEGTAVDAFSLGILMYVVAPKKDFYQPLHTITRTDISAVANVPESYRILINTCISTDPKLRPTAAKIVEELETIADQVAKAKECLMCFEQPIFIRCLPCGHKTVCETCLTHLQQRTTSREPPRCILCRQVITSTQEDINTCTFIEVPPPS